MSPWPEQSPRYFALPRYEPAVVTLASRLWGLLWEHSLGDVRRCLSAVLAATACHAAVVSVAWDSVAALPTASEPTLADQVRVRAMARAVLSLLPDHACRDAVAQDITMSTTDPI